MVFTPHHNQAATSGFGKKLASLGLLSCLVVAVLSYLYFTNDVATKGYQINDLEKDLRAAAVTSQRLETEVAAKQLSKNSLVTSDLPEGYVAVEKIEYLASEPQVGVAVK